MSVDLRLSRHGKLLDHAATAIEISREGFTLEARCALQEGWEIDFVLDPPLLDNIRGRARVVWAAEERGRMVAGAVIIEIKRADAKLLRRLADPQALDYARATRMAFAGLVCGMLAVAVEDVLRHRPVILEVLIGLLPEAAALTVMGLAVILAFRLK